jgi:hypothetical protein
MGDVRFWLKAIGHARGPLEVDWLEGSRSLVRTGFPRRPRMEPGHRLVYYASVWRRIFAVVEVTSEPEIRPDAPERWPWSVEVAPLLLIPSLDDAPPIEACGVMARSMSQQSHISITPETFERAMDAIASVARG